MTPTEEIKLSQGRQIVSHQDDIELLAWQDKEIRHLSALLNIECVTIEERQRFVIRINDCEMANKELRDRNAELHDKVRELSNIVYANSQKSVSSGSKTIIAIAIILTTINVIIHFI